MHHTFMHFKSKAFFGLTLVTGLGLITTSAAHAQSLDLGQSSPALSGTATLFSNGTTASGTFTYYDGGTGTALANQGNFSDVGARGSSTVNVDGGEIYLLALYDTSTLNDSATQLINYIQLSDSSTANFTGSEFSGNVGSIIAFGSSTVNISGETVSSLATFQNSVASVSGGYVVGLGASGNSKINVTGGIIGGVQTSDGGILDLFGTGLSAAYQGNFYSGNPGLGNYDLYYLNGTLQDGSVLPANDQYEYFSGTLEFNGVPVVGPVPEASTTVSLGLLLALGLGGVVIAAKRKKQSV